MEAIRTIRELQASTEALRQQVKLLETKQNSFLSFNSDPFLASKSTTTCKNYTRLSEYCNGRCACNTICLDDFPYNNCTIYDFGIRKQPQFGDILSRPPFNCQVYAFDPSPITLAWYNSTGRSRGGRVVAALKRNPNYHLFSYGGGGADETIILREYNWGQVSIYAYPDKSVAPHNCTTRQCRLHDFGPSIETPLPVRSVNSIMRELGHDSLTILKLDTEGSEYRMLESLITTGACRHIDQLSLEWHHFDFDARYGHGASPHLNVLVQLLQQECDLHQYWIHSPGGWPSKDKLYVDMNVVLRYNLAAFRRGRVHD